MSARDVDKATAAVVRVVAVRDRYARSHPRHASAAGGSETWDLFTREWTTDVHFAAYAPATDPPMRLSRESLLVLDSPAQMVLFVVDVDPPAHVATDDWRASLREKAPHLPPGCFGFWTRNGARLVWEIEPMMIAEGFDWSEWYLWQLVALTAVTGIVADPVCSDWTRLHRAPHATRDGAVQGLGWLCGHPVSIGRWMGVALRDIERAAALGWLMARSPAWRRVSTRLIEAPQPKTNTRRDEDNAAALRWATHEVEHAASGMRNQTLYKVARWLHDKAAPQLVEDALMEAARRAGLATGEARRTIASALASGGAP